MDAALPDKRPRSGLHPLLRQLPGVFALCLLWAAMAEAQTTIDRLGTLETPNARASSDVEGIARALDKELADLQRELVDAASATQRREQDLTTIEESLTSLEEEAEENRRALRETQDRISDLAVALQRISRRPPEAMIAGDMPPLDVVRATLILETLIRDMDQQSAALRDRLATSERIAADIRAGRDRLVRATEALNRDRAALTAMIEEKRALNRQRLEAGTGRLTTLQTLAQSARTIRDLMGGVSAGEGRARRERQALSGLLGLEPPGTTSVPETAPALTLPTEQESPRAQSPQPDKNATAGTKPAGSDPAEDEKPGLPSPDAGSAEITEQAESKPSAPPTPESSNRATPVTDDATPPARAEEPSDNDEAGPSRTAIATPVVPSPAAAPPPAPDDPAEETVASLGGPFVATMPDLPSIRSAKGGLAPPVVGRIVGTFGEVDAVGIKRKGVVLRARARAPVVAPFDGRVLFAGPFRSYGRILVIDHGEGYHSLLAGLGRVDVELGQGLLAGEPVGVTSSPEGGGRPDLYVEIRHNGDPIDPLLWLDLRRNKVNG